LPELYLHGLAHGDFDLALRGLLGVAAPLSAASIARLKASWQMEYESWKRERLCQRAPAGGGVRGWGRDGLGTGRRGGARGCGGR
jgi:hypothetical protein